MIVDTSALIAILTAEEDAAIYAHAIADASVRRLSAASYLECGIALDHQRDPVISRSLDELLAEAEFVIEPVTEHHARLARHAYADFGRGSGHRAGLNVGDCLLRAGARHSRAAAVEGQRLRAYGYCVRTRSVGTQRASTNDDAARTTYGSAESRLPVPARSAWDSERSRIIH